MCFEVTGNGPTHKDKWCVFLLSAKPAASQETSEQPLTVQEKDCDWLCVRK